MQQDNAPAPQLGRMMVFVDGENLVMRYQSLLNKGFVPHDDVVHHADTLVWRRNTVRPAWNVVQRATYYTYVMGDEAKIKDINRGIKKLPFNQYDPHNKNYSIQIPKHLTPCVFKKARNKKAKGVDVQMAVDIISNTYQDNLDTIFLVSGDGDYLPVVQEAVRLGKHIHLAAFSSGLNDSMVNISDYFYQLDYVYFKGPDQLKAEDEKAGRETQQ